MTTGTTISSEGLDARRRRLLFRCWHRGIRETDLIMGSFADVHIATLSDEDLSALEKLIEVQDVDILSWIMGPNGAPAEYDTPLFRKMREFHLRIESKT